MLAAVSCGVIDDSRVRSLFDACQQDSHGHSRVGSSNLHLAGVPDHPRGRLPLDMGSELMVSPSTRARVVLRGTGYEFRSVESIVDELVVSQVDNPQIGRAYDAAQAPAAQVDVLYGCGSHPNIVKSALQQRTDRVVREIDRQSGQLESDIP